MATNMQRRSHMPKVGGHEAFPPLRLFEVTG